MNFEYDFYDTNTEKKLLIHEFDCSLNVLFVHGRRFPECLYVNCIYSIYMYSKCMYIYGHRCCVQYYEQRRIHSTAAVIALFN